MTEFETNITEFIKSAKDQRRYLTEFEEIIPIAHNKRYQWMVRSSLLGKMVKKGLIQKKVAKDRNHIIFYL